MRQPEGGYGRKLSRGYGNSGMQSRISSDVVVLAHLHEAQMWKITSDGRREDLRRRLPLEITPTQDVYFFYELRKLWVRAAPKAVFVNLGDGGVHEANLAEQERTRSRPPSPGDEGVRPGKHFFRCVVRLSDRGELNYELVDLGRKHRRHGG